MGTNHFNQLVRKLLAFGIAASLSGCSSLNTGSPKHQMSSTSDGRREKITPSQQADVQIAFGRAAEHEGNVEEAEAAYRAALKRDKSRGDAHLHLANMLTLKGDYRQAQDEYQKAITATPGNADIFCDIGYSFYLQREFVEAERNLKQALAIDPNHRRAHNNLAVVLAHSNRTEAALVEFRKAGNSDVESHVNLALSLSLEKRWDVAREEYGRAMSAKPTSKTIRSRLRELDRLIASNERRTIKQVATVDRETVPASTSASTPIAPRSLKSEDSQRKPRRLRALYDRLSHSAARGQ
jgi:Tfp pilus assembly protein PilF